MATHGATEKIEMETHEDDKTTQHEVVGRPKSPKSVSFACDVLFTNERLSHNDTKSGFSDFFLLMLLMALALLAPKGQEIANVNDIILVYVGYQAITFLCQSPYSPLALTDLLPVHKTCSRRNRKIR